VKKDQFGRELETRSFRDGHSKNYNLVASVCDQLPAISEMKGFTDEMLLKSYLDNMDGLCYPLLRWILMSNRAHLSLLPKNKHIKEMHTDWQFVLVSDNPQKEAVFRQKREVMERKKGKGKGSFYGFHGSAIGNWHSIFRNGLKNFSGTDKMSAGAAYGAGIYLASDANTSFGYMSAGAGWEKSLLGKNSSVACIALCEVVNYLHDSSGPWGSKPNPVNWHSGLNGIYVVTDESIVVTRYFFIYPQGHQRGHSIKADHLNLPTDIFMH